MIAIGELVQSVKTLLLLAMAVLWDSVRLRIRRQRVGFEPLVPHLFLHLLLSLCCSFVS